MSSSMTNASTCFMVVDYFLAMKQQELSAHSIFVDSGRGGAAIGGQGKISTSVSEMVEKMVHFDSSLIVLLYNFFSRLEIGI
ncbi:hypothetical protein V6N13_144676 [Hibiscus sabdariffa]